MIVNYENATKAIKAVFENLLIFEIGAIFDTEILHLKWNYYFEMRFCF